MEKEPRPAAKLNCLEQLIITITILSALNFSATSRKESQRCVLKGSIAVNARFNLVHLWTNVDETVAENDPRIGVTELSEGRIVQFGPVKPLSKT